MSPGILTALPVYNEAQHLEPVLRQVAKYSPEILVVNDGSSDGTAAELERLSALIPNLHILTHTKNQGYGAALRSAFQYAQDHGFEVLVTIDCDGQHQPELIPALAAALNRDGCEFDIVSGSRYLKTFAGDSTPPEARRKINATITAELNQQLGLRLTDGFCGFKAYRVSALKNIHITELGYAMPLQFWVQSVALGLSIVEFPVPLIYLDEKRSFGGSLDDAEFRLKHYREVLQREMTAACKELPPEARNHVAPNHATCCSHPEGTGCAGFTD
ncbi:MAG: glycosyltransferase family 2 protein [Planctomycetales bacterium]